MSRSRAFTHTLTHVHMYTCRSTPRAIAPLGGAQYSTSLSQGEIPLSHIGQLHKPSRLLGVEQQISRGRRRSGKGGPESRTSGSNSNRDRCGSDHSTRTSGDSRNSSLNQSREASMDGFGLGPAGDMSPMPSEASHGREGGHGASGRLSSASSDAPPVCC